MTAASTVKSTARIWVVPVVYLVGQKWVLAEKRPAIKLLKLLSVLIKPGEFAAHLAPRKLRIFIAVGFIVCKTTKNPVSYLYREIALKILNGYKLWRMRGLNLWHLEPTVMTKEVLTWLCEEPIVWSLKLRQVSTLMSKDELQSEVVR